MKYLYLVLFSCLVSLISTGQDKSIKHTFQAKRVLDKPKVDGVLDDISYKEAVFFEGNFFQRSPDNGALAAYKTKVYIVYTDYGLYIGAQMYDPDPNTIPKELGIRDDMEKNVDLFGIVIDPVNKGQNAFYYIVTASGVQGDATASAEDDDWNWDSVWNSEVAYNDEGWSVEMEIPYSAIRFPKQESSEWGLNFYRVSKRLNEESTWNFVDQEVNGFINQSGTLTGLENIEPPLRLSVSPYLSGAFSFDGATNSVNSTYAGGMDLKLGLSESFTLDMSLIPDFSQVQSDDQVLNLSPFEVQFDENRPFFTEGTELFSKGNIFYSRRVGQSKGNVDEDEDKLGTDEEITSFPSIAPLINATKVSGRTSKGTGIGFFNSISNETYATIKNTEKDTSRAYLIDPLTNYNVVVVDQNLKYNSSFSVINTNVIREGNGRDANVTVGQLSLRDKSNTYGLFVDGGYSHVVTNDENGKEIKNGFRNRVSISKVSGKFNFSTGVSMESDTWDINDLGFLIAPNEFIVSANFSYNIYKPFSVFNNLESWFNIWHEQLYEPRTFASFRINGGTQVQFKNFYEFALGFNINPVAQYDYYEPREEGRYYTSETSANMFMYGATDRRKNFSIFGEIGVWHRNFDNTTFIFSSINPSYRVNNKLNLSYKVGIEKGSNAKGFVDNVYDVNDNLQEIVFGNRDQQTLENVLGINYTFNNKMGITFRLRHYWSWVEYKQFNKLEDDGTLGNTSFDGFNSDGTSPHNSNFNAFNIDFVYSWQIAPGSFININWKDAVYSDSEFVQRSYGENFNSILKGNHYNTVSLKIIYFLDVNYLKKLKKGN